MLADPFRPPIGITLANLDRRKKEHRLRALDGCQSRLIGALCRAGETTVGQLSGEMPVHLVTQLKVAGKIHIQCCTIIGHVRQIRVRHRSLVTTKTLDKSLVTG
ncbi:hypothetical protein D3C76_1601890 [compost metagenome]